MFPTTTKYAIGIPFLLVFMLLLGIDASWSENNLFRSTDDRQRRGHQNIYTRQRINHAGNGQNYREIRDYYARVRDRRNRNPLLYPRQRLANHREGTSKFSNHNNRLPLRESDTFSKNIVVEKSARFPFRARMHRNYNKNDNRITAIDEDPQNGTRSSSLLKENKRDIREQEGKPASRFNRLYRSLARFDLLYLLGSLMLFILASAAVIVSPIATFCWSACTRGPKQKSAAVGPDLTDVLVESAAVADDESARATKPADSYKDIYKNLVSNEIDGEGDTVGKRMKLERWMMQNAEHRPRRSFNRSRHFNSTQMEKVKEEEDSTEENSAEGAEEAFWSESEGPPEDNPEYTERFRQKGDKGAHKQESGPFAFVERMHHPMPNAPYRPNPRHIYTFVDHSRRVPGRTCNSMLDLNTARYSRL